MENTKEDIKAINFVLDSQKSFFKDFENGLGASFNKAHCYRCERDMFIFSNNEDELKGHELECEIMAF